MEIKKKILQGWNNKKKISSSLKILQPPYQKSNGPPLSIMWSSAWPLIRKCRETAVGV